ncbi:MAG: hypothetical protein OEN02_06360 [Gammaproteobacteria bacterium]|nr:hypothetical protein [Gammaproteobacteria bacterium]MDH3535694.1 hypothetical protein [Gammaproteobacteria bacterium]
MNTEAGEVPEERKNLKKASLILFLVGILNAAAGYLREIVVAANYGASTSTDAFFSSYAFVITLSDLLISAALTTSIVPTLGNFRNRPEDRQSLITTLLLLIVAVTVIMALVISFAFPVILHLLMPGLGPEEIERALYHGRWLAWLLPFYGLYWLFTFSLNSQHRFSAPAVGWLTINLTFSLVVFAGADELGDRAMLLGAMCGPILVVIVMAFLVYRENLLSLRNINLASPTLPYAWTLARPMLLTLGIGNSLGLLMLSHLVVRSFGSFTGEGSISAMTYAFRIYEVPLTLVAHIAGIIVLPVMVGLYVNRDWDRIAYLSRELIFWGAFLLVPAFLLFMIEATPIVSLLLERKNFTAQDTLATASALQGFAPVILFEAVIVVYYRIFYALQKPRIPSFTSALALLCLLLIAATTTFSNDLRIIASALSGGFCIGSVYLLYQFQKTTRRQVIPETATLAWLLGFSLVLGIAWWLLARYGGAHIIAVILRTLLLTLVFWSAVLWRFPSQRFRLQRFFIPQKASVDQDG